jgi:UDP-glucose 4-epimerase
MSDQRRAVVTGGAGFIGSHVADRLIGLGYAVLVIDNLVTGSRSNVPAAARFEERDLLDSEVQGLLADWGAEVVVHCAAQVSVSLSVVDPARDARSNVLGSVAAVCGAVAGGCTTFVYITTAGALYGEARYLPTDEDHPIEPISPYGLSKWVGERYVDLLGVDSMKRVVLRLANVYGPRQRSDGEGGVVSIFSERMSAGLPVEINGDGAQTRDLVYVGDVVDAVVAAIDAEQSTTVNIATGVATSILELFDSLAVIAGYGDRPTFTAARAGDVRHSQLTIGKAARELGWTPRTILSVGLAETYASRASADGRSGLRRQMREAD